MTERVSWGDRYFRVRYDAPRLNWRSARRCLCGPNRQTRHGMRSLASKTALLRLGEVGPPNSKCRLRCKVDFRLVAASHASGDDRRLVLIPAIEYHGPLTAAARWKQRDNDLRSACQLLSVVPVGGKLERSSVLMVGCLASCCLAH